MEPRSGIYTAGEDDGSILLGKEQVQGGRKSVLSGLG